MNVLDMFAHWDEVRSDLLRAVDLLSDDDLRFRPREGLRSMGDVLCHVAGAEYGWLGLVRGERIERFGIDGSAYPTVVAVRSLLDEVHASTLATLSDLDTSDLGRQVGTPWGSSASVGWIIWHVLEHEVHHRGEVFLMLGLLGREAPDI